MGSEGRARGRGGVTTFVCRVNTKDAFRNAMQSVYAHNCAPKVPMGEFTLDEMHTLVPEVARLIEKVEWMTDQLEEQKKKVSEAGEDAARLRTFELPERWWKFGCMQKWSRGENILLVGPRLIKWCDAVWLEVENRGGGVCSLHYFNTHYPGVGWFASVSGSSSSSSSGAGYFEKRKGAVISEEGARLSDLVKLYDEMK
eukprot:1108164-Prorocentrum_minimum.AAC.4